MNNTIGYHGDDGGIFHGSGFRVVQRVSPFTSGDTVGCLVKPIEFDGVVQYKVQFTRNGEEAGLPRNLGSGEFYPTVSFGSIHATVRSNFGQQSFLWKGKITKYKCIKNIFISKIFN